MHGTMNLKLLFIQTEYLKLEATAEMGVSYKNWGRLDKQFARRFLKKEHCLENAA
jgi:hypothetical protein